MLEMEIRQRHHNLCIRQQCEDRVHTNYLEGLVGDRLRVQSSLDQGSQGNASKDVLRGEMVGREGYSKHHDELVDLVRSPGHSYVWGRADNVVRILRYDRMSC